MTESAQPPVYELCGVSKTYGGGSGAVHAVREVELTTLLQLLGGLDRPSAGSVQFEGQDLSELGDDALSSLRLSTFGFVFQQFNLIPTLTAAQNVEAALAPSKLKRPERTETVTSLLEQVGLDHRAEHLPSALSGGEQQRVAIARALASEPLVVLADEPTGNLDSTTGAEIVDLLLSLSGEGRRTVVVVTHDDGIAKRVHRTVRMRDGALVAP